MRDAETADGRGNRSDWVQKRATQRKTALQAGQRGRKETSRRRVACPHAMGSGERRMSERKELYACVHVAELPAQALLRLRNDLQGEPVAILEGTAPHEFVCSLNAPAIRRGATHGMTRLDAEA